ncbi:hypothetical protein HPB48_025089 [Haemaphysalis longicornis]|uniref:Uncharacterized protein n=1 Tax=Haemaphysalis longicornis TaxID=44386 RepID=A0A9J6H9U6_HAELO|nr:hypothetical protein HPB48_025089 [Haemaphysalis longicornis]
MGKHVVPPGRVGRTRQNRRAVGGGGEGAATSAAAMGARNTPRRRKRSERPLIGGGNGSRKGRGIPGRLARFQGWRTKRFPAAAHSARFPAAPHSPFSSRLFDCGVRHNGFAPPVF